MTNYDTTDDPYATKVADWTDMRKLVQHARQYKFNRQIPRDVFETLDPEGFSILRLFLFDHDRKGNPNIPVNDPMHHRCWAHLKLRNIDDPYTILIDVADKDYRALPGVKETVDKKASSE